MWLGNRRTTPPRGQSQPHGLVQIQVGWLEAIDRNVVRPAPDVYQEGLVTGLQDAKRTVVGRTERTPMGIMADEHIPRRPQAGRHTSLREAVLRAPA